MTILNSLPKENENTDAQQTQSDADFFGSKPAPQIKFQSFETISRYKQLSCIEENCHSWVKSWEEHSILFLSCYADIVANCAATRCMELLENHFKENNFNHVNKLTFDTRHGTNWFGFDFWGSIKETLSQGTDDSILFIDGYGLDAKTLFSRSVESTGQLGILQSSLKSKHHYIVITINPKILEKATLSQRSAVEIRNINFLNPLMELYSIDNQIVEQVEQQRKLQLWTGSTKEFYEQIHNSLLAERLVEQVNEIGVPESTQESDEFVQNKKQALDNEYKKLNKLQKIIVFVTIYLDDLTIDEFDEVVSILIDEEYDIKIETTTQVEIDEESGEEIETPTESEVRYRLLDDWEANKDQILKELKITPVPQAAKPGLEGGREAFRFLDANVNIVFKRMLNQEAFFIRKLMKCISANPGLAIESPSKLHSIFKVIELSESKKLEYFDSDWLVAIYKSLDSFSKDVESRTIYTLQDDVLEMVAALLQKYIEIHNTTLINEFFENLLDIGHYPNACKLVKYISQHEEFDSLFWIKKMLSNLTTLEENPSSSQLLDSIKRDKNSLRGALQSYFFKLPDFSNAIVRVRAHIPKTISTKKKPSSTDFFFVNSALYLSLVFTYDYWNHLAKIKNEQNGKTKEDIKFIPLVRDPENNGSNILRELITTINIESFSDLIELGEPGQVNAFVYRTLFLFDYLKDNFDNYSAYKFQTEIVNNFTKQFFELRYIGLRGANVYFQIVLMFAWHDVLKDIGDRSRNLTDDDNNTVTPPLERFILDVRQAIDQRYNNKFQYIFRATSKIIMQELNNMFSIYENAVIKINGFEGESDREKHLRTIEIKKKLRKSYLNKKNSLRRIMYSVDEILNGENNEQN